jgi:uncharacterized protein with HEPN domain
MPQRDPAVHLEDIERSLAALARYLAGVSLERYLADDEKRAAVERVLEIAGEALAKLAQTAPALAEQIPEHRSVIAFRNVLAHGYAQLDDLKVYELAHFKAPALLAAVTALLKMLDDDEGRGAAP